ncbi:hypothetical protein KO561_16640 [Radiobacillus kanasensis]|uniref:hypothetical protein n=1 Tax=Radiobacillus kanasensis TaxID=2844358 RepID=UPI001E2B6624|nr:hypothetical protein [Radiobacillus kanasensis]UFT98803.1 hypothetical protein KO561_16640 [Radiobacillus kanasensis]
MIDKLFYQSNQVSWSFLDKKVSVELDHIITASENTTNRYIIIDTGEKFISTRVYYYSFDGNLLMMYDLPKGLLEWSFNGHINKITTEELRDVGYFISNKTILIMSQLEKTNITALNLNGDYLYEISSLEGYEMKFFQELPEHVSIVCDGDTNHIDKFGRNRVNFKLDISTGKLSKGGIAY